MIKKDGEKVAVEYDDNKEEVRGGKGVSLAVEMEVAVAAEETTRTRPKNKNKMNRDEEEEEEEKEVEGRRIKEQSDRKIQTTTTITGVK